MKGMGDLVLATRVRILETKIGLEYRAILLSRTLAKVDTNSECMRENCNHVTIMSKRVRVYN